jgi:predicted transposase YbfD/YdcC
MQRASRVLLFPPEHETVDKGHGRIETRHIWTTCGLNDYIEFPHLKQTFRIERIVTDLRGKPKRHEIVYGVTSLSDTEASAAKLLELNRGHWEIENRLHYVRDVTFDEDRSQVRKGSGPQTMASLRNLAISLLRMSGATNIASATRHLGRRTNKSLRLLGLTM